MPLCHIHAKERPKLRSCIQTFGLQRAGLFNKELIVLIGISATETCFMNSSFFRQVLSIA